MLDQSNTFYNKIWIAVLIPPNLSLYLAGLPMLSFELNKSWEIHDEFKWIKKCSKLSQNEMLKTFNCGIGMIVIVSKNYDKNILKKYNMIEIGKIIKSDKPRININLFT